MCSKKFFKFILFVFLILAFGSLFPFSIVDFFFSFLIYEDEDKYIKAIEKTWKNYPIKNISLIRENGYKEIILMDFKDLELSCECSHIEEFLLLYKEKCSKYKLSAGCNEYHPLSKASKLYGITIYVSYYEEDYLTFFNRIRKDKGYLGKNLCKDGYKRCGYLDIFNNTLCVKEEEDCPINNITFIFNNGTLSEIKTDNTKKNLYIINQLIVSEYYNPTIFDINKFERLLPKNYYLFNNDIYNLAKIYLPKVIYKNEFFEENQLIKGKAPYYFKYKKMNLYHLIYPGMNKEYPIKFLFLFKQPFRSILKSILLVIEIIIFIIILISYIKDERKKIIKILSIIFIIVYLIFFLLNIFFIVGKYSIKKTLEYFKLSVYPKTNLIIDICCIITKFILLVFYLSRVISNIKIINKENNKYENIDNFKINFKN